MNLYADVEYFFAPKKYTNNTKRYFLAENEEGAFIEMNSHYGFIEEYGSNWDIGDDEDDDYSEAEVKEMIMDNKGWDEDDWPEDTYYGVYRHRWKLVKENVTEEQIRVLRELGLLAKED